MAEPKGLEKEYRAWVDMKRRCYNPQRPQYARYGARGVTVCDRWQKDFYAFLADVGRAPAAHYSLDRIDNDGNYEPGNVRWATAKEQSNNQSTNVPLTLNGVTKNVAEWAADKGICAATVRYRLRSGMTPEEAVMKPSKGWRKLIEYRGEHHTEKEWSALLGVPATTIRARARRGQPLQKEQ